MRVRQALSAAYVLGRTRILWPPRPLEYLRMGQLALRWGPSIAAASAVAALRSPGLMAVADDFGSMSWAEVDRYANSLAHALTQQGVLPDTTVGLMCRNSRYFLGATIAVSKLGAHLVLLNTDFGPHQLREVLQREGVATAVFDDEFADAFAVAEFSGPTVHGRQMRNIPISRGNESPKPPERPGRVVVMTSGTTGLPKGAQRAKLNPPIDIILSAFSQVPLKAREPVVVAPPLFHLLGFGFMGFALGLQGTLVLQGRFDPEAVLAAVADHRATTLVAVPVMLKRIIDLPPTLRQRYDTSSLRVIVCSGSSLSPALSTRVMDAFGDILYNFYGSTEVGWAAVARPSDLRAAPGTAGRPPAGTRVVLLDKQDLPVATGQQGRIFVGSGMAFEGYTGGGGKQAVAGLISTGDTGYFDYRGRLFINGRDDEMIVSGGENVFPNEVEELLRLHESVQDAAVVGIQDEEMGQRLAAFVVAEPGSSLSAEELREYVRSRLARFKVPREVEFVDEIPRNAMGKVLRTTLLGG